MIKFFSIAFLETIVETTRYKSTIDAVDTDLIEKEISVTTKNESKSYHRWTPADQFKILYCIINLILLQFTSLKQNFLVLWKALYVNVRKNVISRT